MSTDHNIRQLVINKLTDAQYEQAVKSADELYLTPDTDSLPSQTGNSGKYLTTNGTTTSWASVPAGTVTSVRVQATSPVQSSQNTAQTGTLNTTISLADGYGDTKNPYASKTANTVLAAPNGSNGVPAFRALVKADIPLASETAASGGTTTSLVTTGEKYTWNSKQDALSTQTAYISKGSATKVPQITTNTLGQVTGITEVTITQPTVNNKTITIQKNSTTVDSFTLNQSTDKTINITVPTKTSDITNDSGFLTAESDTLGDVLNRGNSATTDINMNNKDLFNSGVKLTSYYYSTSQTPNTQFYWYKLEPPTSGSKADRYFISIDSDVNYPQNRATFLLDISKYSTNSYNVSLNCLAMTGGTGTHVLNVAIDADGYVYVQSDAVWSSYMRFVRYGTESSTISYTQVGLAAFGTADGFTPVKIIQDTGCIRLVDGALSGTYYTLIPSNYFRGDLKGNADTATKATKDADGNTISTTYLKSHQSIKTLKTDNTTAQTASSSEAIAGSGTINLHKVSKTGSYNDLLNKPTIPTVNDATLTIQQNGTTVTTFSANASSVATANIATTVVKFRDWSAS